MRLHTHFSVVNLVGHFFSGVLVMGTIWRLTAFWAVAASNPLIASLGKAMLVQY
ncbi:MAG: hypothetical protein ACRDRL_10110 [Sciscionella sp.]